MTLAELEEAYKNKEIGKEWYDQEMQKLKNAWNLIPEGAQENIKSGAQETAKAVGEVWSNAREFKPWYQPGENIGALGIRGIEGLGWASNKLIGQPVSHAAHNWLGIHKPIADTVGLGTEIALDPLAFGKLSKISNSRKAQNLVYNVGQEAGFNVRKNISRIKTDVGKVTDEIQYRTGDKLRPLTKKPSVYTDIDQVFDSSGSYFRKANKIYQNHEGGISWKKAIKMAKNKALLGSVEDNFKKNYPFLSGKKGKTKKNQPYAYESRFAEDLDADVLTANNLSEELIERISFDLGYNPDKIGKKTIKSKLIPDNEISTIYLQHARAFEKSIRNTSRTLEEFPNLIYQGNVYRPKVRTRHNRKTGKVTREVGLEPWTDRVTRRNIGRTKRALRIKAQTNPDVAKGTFAYQKIKQLRERNIQELKAGVPRSKLRDMDMDHKNALRTVEIYTEGLPEHLKEGIFQELGKEGLFTGDDARNLILRNKKVHAQLYPELKTLLKKLKHKTSKNFKTPEEYYEYLTKSKNPKTELTPLQEYAEAVYKVEETGDDLMADLLKVAAEPEVPEVVGGLTKAVTPTSSHRDLLIEIFGSVEDYESFMRSLRDLEPNLQRDFIIGEIEYAGVQPPPLTKQEAIEMVKKILPY